MQCAARQSLENPVVAEEHLLECRVVGQHAHDDVAARGRVTRRAGEHRPVRHQRLGLLRRAVPHHHLMARAQKIRGHAGAHLSESQKADLHGETPANLSVLLPDKRSDSFRFTNVHLRLKGAL